MSDDLVSEVIINPGLCIIRGNVLQDKIKDVFSTLDNNYRIKFEKTTLSPFQIVSLLSTLSFYPSFYLSCPSNWGSHELSNFGKYWFSNSFTKKISRLAIANFSLEISSGLLSFLKNFRCSKNSKLKSLYIRDIILHISPYEKEKYFGNLSKYLFHTTSKKGLEELTMDSVMLGDIGMEYIIDKVITSKYIKGLTLKNTNVNISPKFYHDMIKKLSNSCYLTTISLDIPIQFTTGNLSSTLQVLYHHCKTYLSNITESNIYLKRVEYFKDNYNPKTQILTLCFRNITQKLINLGLLRQIGILYPNLLGLNLSNNTIGALSYYNFSKFRELEELNLDNNPLHILSPAIAQLQNLKSIKFNSNPTTIPKKYYNDINGIREYYKSLKELTEINKHRLFIFGSSSISRETFINSLCTYWIENCGTGNERMNKVEKTHISSTSVIPNVNINNDNNNNNNENIPPIITCWQISNPKVFNTCNFIYKGSSTRTIYIVLFKLSNPPGLLRKLNLIQNSSPEALVYIIGNLTDCRDNINKFAITLEEELKLWKRRMGNKSVTIERCIIEGKANCIFWPVDWSVPESFDDVYNSIQKKLTQKSELLPLGYDVLLQIIKELRIISPSPIIYGSEIRKWCKELLIEDFSKCMDIFTDWGEVIYFPEENDMVIINPLLVPHFIEVTFKDLTDPLVSVLQVESNWKQARFSTEWSNSYWNILYKFDICTRFNDEKNTILVPHLAPERPRMGKRNRLKRFVTGLVESLIMGRQFIFDFSLPGLVSRLLNRVICETRNSKLVRVISQTIYIDAVILELGLTSKPSVKLYFHQNYTQSENNLFQLIMEVEVHVLDDNTLLGRQVLGATCFLVDNFMRDQYPQLHENHMTEIVLIQDLHKLKKLMSREECVQQYFTKKIREFDGCPVENLIPEVLDPISIFATGEKKEQTFNAEDLKIIKKIGSGKSGTVFKALWNDIQVAWKVFKSEAIDEFLIRDFCQEVSVLCKLDHPNIVRIIGFALAPQLSVCLEFCEGGTFENALREHENKKSFDWKLVVKTGLDIARAIGYLHSQTPAIIHNDLKPDNIMVVQLDPTAPVCVKLIDFGFSIATLDGKRKDIQSFGTMYEGITKFYCSRNARSAKVPMKPTIKHPSIFLNIPEKFDKIILACKGKYSAERLEYALSKLWRRIITGSTVGERIIHARTSGLAISRTRPSVSSLFENANKSVILQMITKLDSTSIESSIDALKPHVYDWIYHKDFESLNSFFETVDINIGFNDNKDTVLMYACQTGNIDAVRFFLKHPSIDIDLWNNNGYTAAHFAVENGFYGILEFLVSANASVHESMASLSVHKDLWDSLILNNCNLENNSMNILECAIFSLYEVNNDIRKCSNAEGIKKDIKNCITILLRSKAYLSDLSTCLPDRLEYIRGPLFEHFKGCLRGTSTLESLENLFRSVNMRELSRIQTMLDTCIIDKDPNVTPSDIKIQNTIWQYTNTIKEETITTTNPNQLTCTLINVPDWLQISYSKKFSNTLPLEFTHIALNPNPNVLDGINPSHIIFLKIETLKNTLVRYIIIRFEELLATPRNSSKLDIPILRSASVTVLKQGEEIQLQHNKKKLRATMTFKQPNKEG